MVPTTPLILRKDAPDYLLQRWGVVYSANYLERLVTLGGGPRYSVVGNRSYYATEDLDAWIESKRIVRFTTSDDDQPHKEITDPANDNGDGAISDSKAHHDC